MAEGFNYGGQAIIDGVMMRGQNSVVTAVRHPVKGLIVESHPFNTIYTPRIRKMPIVRGVVSLFETLVQGTKILFYSADISLEEEGEKMSGKMVGGVVALAITAGVALFFLAPLFLTKLLHQYVTSPLLFNVLEGGIRLGIFLIYLKAMTLQADVRKLFTYHGAEHKALNAYESGDPLEVESARKYSTVHPRCGTSFMFLVLLIAIFVFAIVGLPSLWLMVVSRILLIPLIAGIAHEVTRYAVNHTGNRFFRAVLAPGLWLQSLTTGEPDDNQIEVALSALKKAIELDHPEEVAQPSAE